MANQDSIEQVLSLHNQNSKEAWLELLEDLDEAIVEDDWDLVAELGGNISAMAGVECLIQEIKKIEKR